ncbi:hypothetical protein [Sphingobium lactosutens]|uniref:Uncharacterized protein n=1 Tax=Sphingobium lactosutens DS20 TaxID=1331060 RepID=T0HYC0_9SPHN|nr:hypothetical protein [Sphingobium lactosutens]EQB17073.1 hypothetical protein RLDS_05390 [Sphingobium lactosutens DS20]
MPPLLVLDPPVELLVEELVDDELLVEDDVDELPLLPVLPKLDDELLDDELDELDEDDELLPDEPPVEPG